MYTDKDNTGAVSVMEITKGEAEDLGTILLNFEYMADKCTGLSVREKKRLVLASAKLRFMLIDALA